MSEMQMMQVQPLELHFNASNVQVVDINLEDGETGKRLIVIHPCGIAAILNLPEAAAKQIGAQLMGSGRIQLASSMPPGPV